MRKALVATAILGLAGAAHAAPSVPPALSGVEPNLEWLFTPVIPNGGVGTCGGVGHYMWRTRVAEHCFLSINECVNVIHGTIGQAFTGEWWCFRPKGEAVH